MRYVGSEEADTKAAVANFLMDILTPHGLTEEEIAKFNEDAEKYEGKGFDVFMKQRNEIYLEQMTSAFLQYLPEQCHDYVRNKSLVKGAALSENIVQQFRETAEMLGKERDDLFKAWREEIAAIKEMIPGTVRRYIDGQLHDSCILAVQRPNSHRLSIELDTSSSVSAFKKTWLIFDGVRADDIPEETAGSWWVQDEYHLAGDGAFLVEVLLAGTDDKGPYGGPRLWVEAVELKVKHQCRVCTQLLPGRTYKRLGPCSIYYLS